MKNLFNLKHFKGDLFGGLTAGIVALPLALAFGVSSGLGPQYGIYGAIFISFFAALFGGTPTQISGPTAPMTAVSMVVIGGILAINDGDIEKALPSIVMVFLLAGIFQIILGILGLGKYIRFIPYPVVSGFMTAIGIIIIVTQLQPALGYNVKEDTQYVESFKLHAEEEILENILKEEEKDGILVLENMQETAKRASKVTPYEIFKESKALAEKESKGVIGTFKILPRALKKINWLELLLALGTILIVFGFKKITTVIPSALVALVVMSGIAIGFNLNYNPISEIPSGLPKFQGGFLTGFNFGDVTPYIFTALTLALLGAIDSLLTSVVADNMTKTKHNPNKELIGQGIGNSISSLFAGLPGAGATIRTVVNINAGGKTRLSGMFAGIFLLIILLALGPIASKIPAAVLAGILITVGISVMDYKGLKAIPYLTKDMKIGPFKFSSEVLIMFLVMILSSVWDLIYAVGIGLVFASLIFMKRIGDMTSTKSNIKSLNPQSVWDDEIDFPQNLKEEVFIKHINGPLFFGSTSNIQELAKQIPETASLVVIRAKRMNYIDQSGLYALEDILVDLAKNNIKIAMVNITNQPKLMMERIDIIPDLVPNNMIFDNFEDCTDWIKDNVEDIFS
ncbi:SulP family inorganic anion transporter [Flavobacteriales bacterium]|nr:SulP family inorganic anion transporter [Flavobacteriales bacterium]